MGAACPATTDLPSMAFSPGAMPVPALSQLNGDTPPCELQQEVVVQAGMHAACSLDIEALTRVHGLREVIAQIESGKVQAIRDKYGPQLKRPGDPMWPKIKVAVTRWEWLYTLFKKEFNGDKEHFFAFFSKNQHKGSRGCSLEAFRTVVEAIPHMEKDLWAEREKPEYVSEVTWAGKWKGLNKMEIWRAIGKENYGRCKHWWHTESFSFAIFHYLIHHLNFLSLVQFTL
jgi:hypothetical protein